MSRRDNYGGINVDWMTFMLYFALIVVGWMMIYAVGYKEENPSSIFDLKTNIGKQTLFLGLSFIVLFLTSIIDWKFWRTFAYPIFGFAMVLLIGVLIIGVQIKGATSWYRLPGGFTLQPAEFAKFATCLAISAFLSTYNTNIRTFRHQVIAFSLFLFPMFLILLQPDAGSAIVFTSFLIMLYREGLSPNFYIVGAITVLLLILGLVFDPLFIVLGLVMISTLILMMNLKNKVYWLISFVVLLAASVFMLAQGLYSPVLIVNSSIFLLFTVILWQRRKSGLVLRLFSFLIIGGIIAFSANYSFNNLL